MMSATFSKNDIMKALNIYMILQGYETNGRFDFRWKNELTISVGVKYSHRNINFEALKEYANKKY